MPELALGDAARVTGGRIVGRSELTLRGATLDSRQVVAGQLFVAVRGERADGHDFVDRAFAAGAVAALVERELDCPDGRALLVVESVPTALLALARATREREGWTVVAITGSAGKTTTKDLTARMLARRAPTERSPGNRNNTLGLPEAILGAPSGLRTYVAECGMSHAGELARLAACLRPNVVTITNVAAVHLEFFASVDDIARAKEELIAGAGPGAFFVGNADDPRVVAIADRHTGPRILFGLTHPRADVRARDLDVAWNRTRFVLQLPSGSAEVELPLGGAHQVGNFLAAAAAGFLFGLSAEDMAAAVADFVPAEHRGGAIRLTSGATVLDESYNSNPQALEASAKAFAAGPGRRFGILGEMRELGSEAAALHRETGRRLAPCFDRLIAVGGADARALLEGAKEGGLTAVTLLPTPEAAAAAVAEGLGEGDRILVKGSRGVALERAVAALVRGGD